MSRSAALRTVVRRRAKVDASDRLKLAEALHRVIDAGIALDGAADHGVSESIYLRDPDQNGVELYCDRPKELWPRAADSRVA